MTATTAPPTPSTSPGPLTLAAGRLGRLLGVNIRIAQRADEIAIVLDNDAVVTTSSATKDGAIANATSFLNKLAAAVEHRLHPSAAPAQHPSLTTLLPEAKVRVAPSVRRIG